MTGKSISRMAAATVTFVCVAGVAPEGEAANEIYLTSGPVSETVPTGLYRLSVSPNAIEGTLLHSFTEGSGVFHAIAVPPGEDTVIAVDRLGRSVIEVTGLASMYPVERHLCDLPVGYGENVVQLAYSPDGVLYGTNRIDDTMFTLDLTVDCTPQNVAPVKANSAVLDIEGADIAFTRGGSLFLVSNGTGKLYLVSPTIDADAGAYLATPQGELSVMNNTHTGLAVTPSDQLLISNTDDFVYDLETDGTMANGRQVDLDPDAEFVDALDIDGGDMANQFRLAIGIDIKPGGDPNSININNVGQVPVAILGSDDFDATLCDPASVTLAGGEVRLIGKGDKFQSSIDDVNLDGWLDLVVQIDTADWMVEPGDDEAELTATCDGLEVAGTDSIRIVPSE